MAAETRIVALGYSITVGVGPTGVPDGIHPDARGQGLIAELFIAHFSGEVD